MGCEKTPSHLKLTGSRLLEAIETQIKPAGDGCVQKDASGVGIVAPHVLLSRPLTCTTHQLPESRFVRPGRMRKNDSVLSEHLELTVVRSSRQNSAAYLLW